MCHETASAHVDRRRRLKWNIRELVHEDKLTMLIDADAPRGWAWRFLLLRSEVEALAVA